MSDPVAEGSKRFDKVVERLYMGGGFIPVDEVGRFDSVVVCAPEAWDEERLEAADTLISVCRLRDAEPDQEERRRAVAQASWITDLHRGGLSVLVTCLGGFNRSGLVVGLTLRMLGYDAAEAIRLVKAARGPFALSNKHFVLVIEEWVP